MGEGCKGLATQASSSANAWPDIICRYSFRLWFRLSLLDIDYCDSMLSKSNVEYDADFTTPKSSSIMQRITQQYFQ